MALAHALSLSRSTATALCAIGVFWGGLAAMIPRLQAEVGVGDGELGALLFLSALGALAAMASAPRIGARFPRAAMPATAIAMAVAAVALGLSNGSPWLFGAALIAIGMTTGLLDILANARIATLEARHETGLMNLNHAIYSLSYAVSAIATGLAREAEISTLIWFTILGLVALALAPTMAGPPSQDRTSDPGKPHPNGRLPVIAVVAGIAALLAFFAENATEHWSALHLERTFSQGAALGALGPAMLGLTMGLGRLAGHFVTPHGRELDVMSRAACLAASGLLLAATAPSAGLAYVGFALLGIGVSVVAPLALAFAGRMAKPATRARAVAWAAMIGYGGFFLGPPLMGFLAEFAGLRAAFGCAAISLICIPVVLVPMLRRRSQTASTRP